MINTKKLFTYILVCNAFSLSAGGLLTNTNQSVHFVRNPARDASIEIDAVYTNPAGLTHLPEGFHFSITNQSAFQTRTITSTFQPFAMNGGNPAKVFEGTASAPIVPSVMGVYRINDWAVSGSFAISGGGGKATFNDGLPSFEAGLSMLPGIIGTLSQMTGLDISANKYSVDAYMRGSSFIYGAQLGGTYKINDMFSAYGGFRLNIVNNRYEGHLRDLKTNLTAPSMGLNGNAMVSAEALLAQAIQILGENTAEGQQLVLLQKASSEKGANLDCSQSGWGISPIIGVNFNYNQWNVGVKYEFKTALNVENKTVIDDTGLFRNGVNTPHDIPSLLTIGVAYTPIEPLTISAGYHHFFDSDAKMDNDKQKYINGGTNEYLGGAEFRINRLFLVSAGFQITRYGITDDYQKDLSFACNSWTFGFGGAANVSPTVRINIGYFQTFYDDWTRHSENYSSSGIAGTDVFSRANKVFSAGVDFSF